MTQVVEIGVKWVVAASVLLWFAWRIATSSTAAPSIAQRPIGCVTPLAFQRINPKS